MASSTTRIPASENMSPGKKTARAPLDIGKRAPLQELTPNASMARTLPDANPKGRKSMPSSPLKRQLKDVLGDDKGLTYLKRRRLSHDQALNTSIAGAARDKKDTTGFRPLSPPSSRGYVASRPMVSVPEEASHADQDAQHSEDESSGRDSGDSNATRGSFSSLINYDPSSQQAHAQPSASNHKTHTSKRRRIFSLSSQAEMLRLRLKVAIYKVRTNQINVPFSRLRVRSPPPVAGAAAAAAAALAASRVAVPRRRQLVSSSESPDLLPLAPPMRSMLPPERPTPIGLLPAPVLTESVYARRYMPVQETLSSSPPVIHMSRGSGMGVHHLAMTPPPTADRDSLDSEATELAEDQEGNGGRFAESPLQRNRRDGVAMGGTLR